jgi:HlyD family secretion protein
MKKTWIFASIALAALAAAVWWLRPAAEPVKRASSAQGDPAERRIVAQAQVVPIDGIVDVRPLTDGRVLSVQVHPGDRVSAGQLLAEIESDTQAAALDQREADVRAASERFNLAREGVRPEDRAALDAAAEAALQEAELARERWQRQSQLYAGGFVSEQTKLDAERTYAAAQSRAREANARARAGNAGGRPAEVRAARDQVAAAAAALAQTKVQVSRTKIVAPVAGVIMTRNVNPGEIIGPNISAPTLFRIVDPHRLEVRMEIEEELAAEAKSGLAVRFMLPGSQTQVGSGKITRIAPQVEKRSIGADDARIRADSMIRPAWSDFVALQGKPAPPVNFRLEAWVSLKDGG